MVQLIRRQSAAKKDPLKDHWWVLVLAVGLVVGWLSMASPPGLGDDSVTVVKNLEEDAGLESLDAVANPQGAEGSPLGMPGAGASGGVEAEVSSSLYQAPGGAPGAPLLSDAAAPAEAGKNKTWAEAMAKVASGKTRSSGVQAPNNGWGGKSAQSGFSRPKAKFGRVGASRGGGGASTSARLTVVKKAFGLGGAPDEPGLSGGFGDPKLSEGSRLHRAAGGHNLGGLKRASQLNLDALKGQDENMALGGRRSFDASSGGKSALSQLQGAGASGAHVGTGDDGVPMNLKAGDPKKNNEKEFEVPAIEGGEEKNNGASMQDKIMMMVAAAAIGGIMGPAAGGMVTMMMQQEMAARSAQ